MGGEHGSELADWQRADLFDGHCAIMALGRDVPAALDVAVIADDCLLIVPGLEAPGRVREDCGVIAGAQTLKNRHRNDRSPRPAPA